MKKATFTTENIIVSLTKECKKKSQAIVQKFRELEKQVEKNYQDLNLKIEINKKITNDFIASKDHSQTENYLQNKKQIEFVKGLLDDTNQYINLKLKEYTPSIESNDIL